MIKLIAIDMDGTLLNAKKQLLKKQNYISKNFITKILTHYWSYVQADLKQEFALT